MRYEGCTVTEQDGTVKHVKNLGWLLAHRYDVDSITLYKNGDMKVILYLNERGHVVYRSSWADVDVRNAWVKGHLKDHMPYYSPFLNEAEYDDFSDRREHFVIMISSGVDVSSTAVRHLQIAFDRMKVWFKWQVGDEAAGFGISSGSELAAELRRRPVSLIVNDHQFKITRCICGDPHQHTTVHSSVTDFYLDYEAATS